MRNPTWHESELILALSLYFNLEPQDIDDKNPKIIELSKLLNQLTIHDIKKRQENFRNPTGVEFKLNNILAIDPRNNKTGLKHGGKLEKVLFNKYYDNQEQLHKDAQYIIDGIIINKFDSDSNSWSDDKRKKYEDWLNSLRGDNNLKAESTIRVEQSTLRELLFEGEKYVKCGICGHSYPISFIWCSHIKKRADCTNKEKRDLNVVMPMCKLGCDEIYEKGYISVKNGIVIKLRTSSSEKLNEYINRLEDNNCHHFNEKTKKYFDYHLKIHCDK